MEVNEILQRVTFHAADLDQVPLDDVHHAIKESLFVRVRGLFRPDEVRAARAGIRRQFDPRNDRKHDPRDTQAIRGNLQKLQITGGSATNCARFLRMLYNPIFAEDIYGMRSLFIRLARFRNLLFDLPADFAVERIDDGYWTASRMNQYPIGGGFMARHRDREIYAARHAQDDPKSTYQPLLLMSKKGEDFQAGGAYVEHQGEKLFYEDECDLGDVLVYDGRAMHGVADIDPLKPLDLEHFAGRVAALVTLYRLLE